MYESKKPDALGHVDYTATENETWAILYERQKKIILDRACDPIPKRSDFDIRQVMKMPYRYDEIQKEDFVLC